jgi:prepilin-type N-terminal cleavage/methylation domain-containing protein
VPSTRQHGFSLIELLIVTAIIVLIMTVAIPYYQGAVRHTAEIAAMQAVRTLNTAQVQYFSQNGRFASSLKELGSRWIAGDLAAGKKGGYLFRLEENPTGYAIHAEPVKFGVNGDRTFFSDETMLIRENPGPEPASAASPEAK